MVRLNDFNSNLNPDDEQAVFERTVVRQQHDVMRIFITGKPGAGKTTLILGTVEELKKRGYRIGGMVTREVRERGKRVGFKIKALDTGEEGILAWVGEGHPKVGRYAVNLHDLEKVGVGAIRRAIGEADLVAIDEIGAMEFKSREFKNAVEEAVNSGKPLLAVLYRRWVDKFRGRGRIYTLSHENREAVRKEIMEMLSEALKGDI